MTTQPDQLVAILYVDDEPAEHDAVLRRFAADDRFRLVTATTRDDFERSLADDRFDLVVSELRPWGLADLWSLETARGHASEPLVTIVTARGSELLAVEAMKGGAADYIPKTRDYLADLPAHLLAIVGRGGGERAARRRQDRLFEHSLSLLCVVGFDGYIRHWNPAWSTVLGYGHKEVMATPMRELLHPDDRAWAAEVRQQLEQGKSAAAIELRVRGKDGQYRWMLLNATPCVEEQVYFATVQEITARKQIEEQLRESQDRFQTIASATKDAVWDWDLRENRVWRNESYLQLFGAPNDAVDGTIAWWLSRIHPEDRPRVLATMPPPVIEGRQEWQMEYRFLRADGIYAHVYDRGFVVFNSAGESVRMVGSIVDLSELKNTEQKLRESEQRFQLATKATRDAIWDWDLTTGEIWRSEGFQTLFGYWPEDIRPDLSWWVERIHDDERERVLSEIPIPGVGDSRQCILEYRFRRADGTYADVFDRGFVMCDDEGKPVRLIGSLMDVSERRRVEEMAHVHRAELAHIGRLSTMGEIATGLAHELNQPLTAIANYAESCAQALGTRGDEKVLKWIDRITTNTHRAAEIIRRLRGFTRKSEPRRSTVEVGHLIQEVIDLMEAETRLQNIRIRTESVQTAVASVDPIQIQQVLVNLLRNAFEAMADQGPDARQVTIGAVPRGEAVEISVEDLGEGISAENCDRVFEAFFTTKSNGVGIGLAISRSIVEDHGGRLWVTPNPAQGVTFHFTLPLNGAHHVAVAESVRR